MFAILETGGKQYRVAEGEVLEVEIIDEARIDKEKRVVFDSVLLIQDEKLHLGQPYVTNGVIHARIVDEFKSPKVIVFKKKSKKGYKRLKGHRQQLHRITIERIEINPAFAKAAADKPASVSAKADLSAKATAPKTAAKKTTAAGKAAPKATEKKPVTAKKAAPKKAPASAKTPADKTTGKKDSGKENN
ncbi:MAG TPA: 50S ribosomal protein L21 [Candidatus Aminicenantes bacterium]|nr:50S ribosomal protein L21 [Candidatus Aminicenantes bacterium]